MNASAKLKYIRIAPRKIRLVADLIRGREVSHAATLLKFLVKRSARPMLKLLESAVANARERNLESGEVWYVKQLEVSGGPVLKRIRPRAFGRAAAIKKRTSHVTLLLGTREKSQIANPKSQTHANDKNK